MSLFSLGTGVYNFEYDLNLADSTVKAIDRGYERKEHLEDPALSATLRHVAEESNKAIVRRYWNIFQGTMTDDPPVAIGAGVEGEPSMPLC